VSTSAIVACHDDSREGSIEQPSQSSIQYTCGRYDIGQRQGCVRCRELDPHLAEAMIDLSLMCLEVTGQSKVIRDDGVDSNLR
jgi:hypothetical protein